MRGTRVFTVLAAVALLGVACEDDSTGIPEGVEVYTAELNGANEAPTPIQTTATGHAVVTVLGNLVSWKVDIDTPIDSIQAGHIHRHHPDSVAGNVRVDFASQSVWSGGPTGLDFTGTATVGSATVADSILTIMREGRAYVNIHTRVNPGGEIRGTLVRQ
jgi:CHRD domain-containing protein